MSTYVYTLFDCIHIKFCSPDAVSADELGLGASDVLVVFGMITTGNTGICASAHNAEMRHLAGIAYICEM